jgi:hypothetical protein
MLKARCPACGRIFCYKKISDFPHFPFCSERCRMVDLGRWFKEEYRISEKLEGSEGVHTGNKLQASPKNSRPPNDSAHK